MSILAIYPDNTTDNPEVLHDLDHIATHLDKVGVKFERWRADQELADDADEAEVMGAYADAIERLNAQFGFQSVDVVTMRPDNPKRAELRAKFLAEHTHADFEVRFFVDGSGLFSLHIDDKVYCILCEKGDLISIPANTTHWFDMGEYPNFKCIRLFVIPDGWIGIFTGTDIAMHFPSFDEFVAEFIHSS